MATHNSIKCPNCKASSEVSDRYQHSLKNHAYWCLSECNSCNQFFAILRDVNSKILRMYPGSLPKIVDDRIDIKIAVDLEEAYKCAAVSAFRATATMSRRILQVIALDKGAPKTRTTKNGKEVSMELINQIDWLYDNHIITTDLKDAAHQVRILGNKGAHPFGPENTNEIEPRQAEELLGLTEQFVNVLYVVPAITKSLKDDKE